MSKEHNVFISYSSAYLDDLNRLKSYLDRIPELIIESEELIRKESVESKKSEFIKNQMKEKISNADIVLAIAGRYTSDTDWLNWELDMAILNYIPIVGVIPRDREYISHVILGRSECIVNCNISCIQDAIRKWSR